MSDEYIACCIVWRRLYLCRAKREKVVILSSYEDFQFHVGIPYIFGGLNFLRPSMGTVRA